LGAKFAKFREKFCGAAKNIVKKTKKTRKNATKNTHFLAKNRPTPTAAATCSHNETEQKQAK
jgi:hypothetical protein